MNSLMKLTLHRALESGNVTSVDQVLAEMLRKGIDVLQQVTLQDETPLHILAFNSDAILAAKFIQLARENLEAGFQFLKAQNKDGDTALHVAAKGGCEAIVKQLVEIDSDLALVKNKDGETALFMASECGHVAIVELLLIHTPNDEDLDRRADGQTPLHVAVANLHPGVTEKLLRERAELIEKQDAIGRTALHILALVPGLTEKNIPIIGKMLLAKQKKTILDGSGQAPLHLAAKEGNLSLVKVILECRTESTLIPDQDGRTSLHLAVENASQIYKRVGQYTLGDIISSLATRKMINLSDKKGMTALDIAVQKTLEDKQLFLAIQNYLRRHGARQKMFETERIEDSAKSIPLRPDLISVNAVLIATVAFAAAITLPGNIDTNKSPPIPFLLNTSVFQLFVIFDSLAFCTSVGSVTILMFAFSGDHQDEHIITSLCVNGVRAAVTCLALAFGAAIHLVVAHKCIWLAVVVWIMVCYLPIWVKLMTMEGKIYLFRGDMNYAMELIQEVMLVMWGILSYIASPLYFLILPAWKILILILPGKILILLAW